jgi:hypothetical protein
MGPLLQSADTAASFVCIRKRIQLLKKKRQAENGAP